MCMHHVSFSMHVLEKKKTNVSSSVFKHLKPVIWQVLIGGDTLDIMKGKAVVQLREKLGSTKYGIFS